MINIKRPKSKNQLIVSTLSEHMFEIAAGLFVVMIVGLGTYIVVRTNSKTPSSNAAVAGLQTSRIAQDKNDLLNTIAQNSSYKYFFDALTKTGVYKEFKESEKYTILIPADSAFKTMSDEERNNLFADKDRLTRMVKNHIISGELKRLEFDRVEFMRSLNGKFITINKTDYGTLFNTAKLMSSGSQASNGIIYEIDSIIP